MTEREMVIAHLTERMIEAFIGGNLVDARNINAYLGLLDAETDKEFAAFEINDAEAAA